MKDYQSLKPYEMGLQISRCIYSEATEEENIRVIASATRGDIPRTGGAQGIEGS